MLSPESSLRESVALVPGMCSNVDHEIFYLMGRGKHLFPAWLSGPNTMKHLGSSIHTLFTLLYIKCTQQTIGFLSSAFLPSEFQLIWVSPCDDEPGYIFRGEFFSLLFKELRVSLQGSTAFC